MKKQDLGINPKTGKHNKLLTRMEFNFLDILWLDHNGKENKISAGTLACRFAETMDVPFLRYGGTYDAYLGEWKRHVRYLQNHLLIEHNIPIFSRSGIHGGYWIGTEEEGKTFYNSFRQRGLTGLTKASRGKQAVLVEMVEQLSFEFDDLEDKTGMPVIKIDGRSTPIAVVDALIRKMMCNPERFSADLQKLGRQFGSVLLPKAQAREIETTARKLQDLVSGLV
jgi:hypothetical protein